MFCNIPNANVAAIADGTAGNADSRTMAYDGLDRLTTTNAPHQWWISAATTYDALDNIRANQVGNTATYLNTFSYDPTTWHLTAIAGHVNWALSYDQNGNVISKGTGNDAYAFDAANRMTSVTGKESYRYDGYGRRVKITRSTDGKIDYPVYDLGGQLLTEDDQRSNQTTDYVSLNGSLVAKRASAIGKNQWTTTYEHTDALRSPRDETSATGTLTRAELYTPYGEPGDGKYVQGPGYTGHVTDAATHLTYAQQRYYDPVMGRFLSTDPVQASDSGASFNRYWYANNNPYKFTDKDGRQACMAGSLCIPGMPNGPSDNDPFFKANAAGGSSQPKSVPKIVESPAVTAGKVNHETRGMKDSKFENESLYRAQVKIAHVRINGISLWGDKVDARAKMASPYYGGNILISFAATMQAGLESLVGIDPTHGAVNYNMRTPDQAKSLHPFMGQDVHTVSGPYLSPTPYTYVFTYGP